MQDTHARESQNIMSPQATPNSLHLLSATNAGWASPAFVVINSAYTVFIIWNVGATTFPAVTLTAISLTRLGTERHGEPIGG